MHHGDWCDRDAARQETQPLMKRRQVIETTAFQVKGADGFRQDVQVDESVEPSVTSADGLLDLLDPSIVKLVATIVTNPGELQ